MTCIKIIQIGDIHYPKVTSDKYFEKRDVKFPDYLLAAIEPRPLQNNIRNIKKDLDDGANLLVINGDLTEKGDVEGYLNCIRYLTESFELKRGGLLNSDSIHVVPGNHDLIQKMYKIKDEDLFSKFDKFEQAWSDCELPLLAVKKPRVSNIGIKNRNRIKVYSLNSCIGCGEIRYLNLPEEIKEEMGGLFEKLSDKYEKEKLDELFFDKIDTPAFSNSDIQEVSNDIRELDINTMPIIVAHHNLLPNAGSKIALYSEIVNAGRIARNLSESNKSIIYLHGHIHNTNVEIYRRPENNNFRLICVAAPRITDGYNVILIHFNEKGYPIGCQIDKNLNSHGVNRKETISVKLVRASDMDSYGSKGAKSILSCFGENTNYVRYEQLRQILKNKNKNYRHETLNKLLRECEWFGVLEIVNIEANQTDWLLRKVI